MSRKMDWADKEAKKLADGLGINRDDKSARALITVTMRLAFEKGASDGIERVKVALNLKETTDATT